MRNDRYLAIILLLFGLSPAVVWAEKPTKDNTSIQDIMKEAHKKPKELLKRVALGQASKEETQRLLDLYQVLAQHKPPQGDQASWDEKTKLLVESVQAVIAAKPEGTQQLSKASNCKACHDTHK